MRRSSIVVLLAALVLLAAAGLAGYRLALRMAPGGVRVSVEKRLAGWAGAPVSVGSLAPAFGHGLGLTLRDLHTGGGPGEPGIDVGQASVFLDLPSLLLGHVRLGRVDVDGVRVRVARDADGTWRPAALESLLRRLPAAAGESGAARPPAAGALLHVARTLRELLDSQRALPSIRVRDAQARLLATETGTPPAMPALDGVGLRFEPRHFLGGVDVRAHGRLDGGSAGGFELRVHQAGDDSVKATLALTALTLDRFAPWFAVALPGAQLRGRISGYTSWSSNTPDTEEIGAEFLLRDFRARIQGAPKELTLSLPDGRAAIDASVTPRELRVRSAQLVAGAASLQATGVVERPLVSKSRTHVELRASGVALSTFRTAALALPFDARGSWRPVVDRLQAGRLVSLSLSERGVTLGQWRALPTSSIGAWPSQMELGAQLADATLQLRQGATLTGVSGRLRVSPERLELHDVVASFDDRPLPRLDLTVDGIHELRAARAAPRPAHARAGDVPGLLVLERWLRGEAGSEKAPHWSRVVVDAGWINHPASLWPVEDLHAVFAPRPSGLDFQIERARWGGVPVSGTGTFDGDAPGHLILSLRAQGSDAPAIPRARDGAWARGHLTAELRAVGPFPARALAANFEAVGDELTLSEAQVDLVPRGTAQGTLGLDLSRRDAVPFTLRFQLAHGSVQQLAAALGLGADAAKGDAAVGANLRGRLVPGEPLLAHLAGPLSVHLRDGAIRQRLPVVLAIASASNTLDPFPSRDEIPYRAVDAELELAEGQLETQSMTLSGPKLRLVATGRVDVLDSSHNLEAVVGVFFFRTLDAVIGKVPVLNWVLLGSNKNLVGIYFALSGPWNSPEASLVPVKTLTSGPASFVVEGVPAFVRGGLSRIESLFGGLLQRPAEEEPQPAPKRPTSNSAGAAP